MRSKVALLAVFGVFAFAAVYRALHFALTGFFVPDEYGYAYFHLGQLGYQGRDFVNLVNIILLEPTGAGNGGDGLALMMPVYFAIWFSVGMLAAYKTMQLLGHEEKTIVKTLLLALTIPVFLLFSVTVTTEPVAFAVTMLGIYLAVRFVKKGGMWLVPTSALCFVAANYTRADFSLFMFFGFVPMLWAIRRNGLKTVAKVFVLFALPVAFFSVFPYNSVAGPVGVVQDILVPAAHVCSNGCASTAAAGHPTLAYYTVPTAAQMVESALWVSLSGFFVGFNPVVAVLILAGLFMALKARGPSLWYGLISLGIFAGVAFTYSAVWPPLPISTTIRYSYDCLPAYFLLAPFALKRVGFNNVGKAIVYGLVLSGGVGILFYQDALQSNLGSTYPFLGGHDDFLSLGYRTPMAAMRDWFSCGCSESFIILGEDPLSLDGNLTNLWRFTPGTAGMNVTFEPYSYGASHPGTFYLYTPSDLNSTLTAQIRSLKLAPGSPVELIAGGTGWSFTEITVS